MLGVLAFGTVVPMLAVASEPFDDERFHFEAKLDGVRCVAFCTARGVRLQNRRLRDITSSYPDVVEAVKASVRPPALLDGEIVTLVDGVPDFRKLMERENSDAFRSARMTETHPATLYAFDLLWAEGDLRPDPIERRREELASRLRGDAVLASPFLPGQGTRIFREVVDAGFEGVVAKLAGSPYRTGVRSKDWRKVKRVGEMDVVVGGWTEGEGRRAGTIGSLVVGLWSPDGLLPVARVGSGLRDEDLSRLLRLLRSHARAESPFAMPVERDVHFVHPRLVAVVEYHQITADGHLRAPVFKGLRDDKAPEECGPGRAYRRWLDERAGGSPSPASAHH